jgi:hypothetical protein
MGAVGLRSASGNNISRGERGNDQDRKRVRKKRDEKISSTESFLGHW